MYSKFSTVRVVGGSFKDELKGQRGEVDHSLSDGSVVVTFRHGHGDDAKSDSFLLSENSLSPAKATEKIAVEKEVERSIGLRTGFDYI